MNPVQEAIEEVCQEKGLSKQELVKLLPWLKTVK
jgi:hypothetical protein